MKIPRLKFVALQQIAQVEEPFGDHVNDLSLFLQISLGLEQSRMPGGAAVALVNIRLHNQIHDAGFVFKGFEDDA